MKLLSKEELNIINGGTGGIQALGAAAKHAKCAIDDFADTVSDYIYAARLLYHSR